MKYGMFSRKGIGAVPLILILIVVLGFMAANPTTGKTLFGLVPILGGLTFVALFVTHGAIFVALKTDGPIRSDSRRIAERMGLVTVVLAVALLLLLGISDGTAASWATTIVAAVALLGALQANRAGREGWAFLGTAVTIALAVATYFLMLFPNVMPSSTNPAWNLTVDNASSSDYTLKVMTVVALIFTPLVLVYQAWTYWIFRKRVEAKPEKLTY